MGRTEIEMVIFLSPNDPKKPPVKPPREKRPPMREPQKKRSPIGDPPPKKKIRAKAA